MSDMNTEQCKALIMKVMNQLISKVSLDDMAEYRRQTGQTVQEVLDIKQWKRARKWVSIGSISREFTHTGLKASMVIIEVIGPNGGASVEIELSDMPAPLAEAANNLEIVTSAEAANNLEIVTSAEDLSVQAEDKPSMKEGPKPGGFGAFA